MMQEASLAELPGGLVELPVVALHGALPWLMGTSSGEAGS